MNKDEFMAKYQMREIKENDGFAIDIMYSSENNFTKRKIYSKPICMLRSGTVRKLIDVNGELKYYGFKLKLWDTFRPLKYQEKLWKIFPDEKFVANPNKNKCNHCKGMAVDVTLSTLDNKDVSMPTEFDHFGVESYRNYYSNLDVTIQKNVSILETIMTKYKFVPNQYEWWHFDDCVEYEIIREMYD